MRLSALVLRSPTRVPGALKILIFMLCRIEKKTYFGSMNLITILCNKRMNFVEWKNENFSPSFKNRKIIVEKGPRNQQKADSFNSDHQEKVRQERLRWTEMLKRVFPSLRLPLFGLWTLERIRSPSPDRLNQGDL